MNRNIRIALVLLMAVPYVSYLHADEKEKYKLFADEIRQEVWSLDLPAFRQVAVPEQYKDESAVILAAYSQLEAVKKTKLHVGQFLLREGLNHEVHCRDLFRMLTDKKMRYGYIPKSAKKSGLQANPDAKLIEADDWEVMTQYGVYVFSNKRDRDMIRRAKNSDWSEMEKADFIYNYLYFDYAVNRERSYNPTHFIIALRSYLSYAGIPFQMGITTSTDCEPLSKLISYRNTSWFVYCKNIGRYYFPPTDCPAPGEIPARHQGQEARLSLDKSAPKAEQKKQAKEGGIWTILPVSTPADNRDLTTMEVNLDGTVIGIDRTEAYTGILKEGIQRFLITYEDLDADLRRQLDIDKSLDKEVGKKYAADLQEWLRKDREREKDCYKQEIKNYHEAEARTLEGYELISIGNRADSSSFCYRVRYDMDGFVRKAGGNLVLSAGRLIGDQLKLEENDRKRTVDIFMSAPRMYEWDITVNLPAGYSVSPEGLQKMNVRVENECGLFQAQATAKDGKLKLHVIKQYTHRQEPLQRWEQLQAIIDAAKTYETLSVVLKK